MNVVKHYVEYSMNECINDYCLFVKERHIYMKWDVRNVWNVRDVQRPQRFERFEHLGTFAQIAKPNWQTSRGKLSLFRFK